MPQTLLALYRTMARIRAFENAAEALSQGGVTAFGQTQSGAAIRGPLHLSTGQEAVAAGVCHALRADDLITSTHRGHGHLLAKGAELKAAMAELFGRATGCNRGKGGSMHVADFRVGMLGANGVVAAGLPIAVGAAHALRLRGVDAIAVAFFGDGAINRGPFFEALNWAGVFRVPVLFVCEDNRWSATSASGPLTAGEGAPARARAFGVAAASVDGNDVLAVHQAASWLVGAIRQGEGPQLLHARTYRFKGHVSVDPAAYRDADEVAAALADDPLRRARERGAALDLEAATFDRIDAQAAAEVADAVEAARVAPWPDADEAFTDVLDLGGDRWR